MQKVVLFSYVMMVCEAFSEDWDDFAITAWNIEQHINVICCTACWAVIFKDIIKTFFKFSQTVHLFHNFQQWLQDDSLSKALLWELLILFHFKKATDHWDKVYALLDLIREWLKKKSLYSDYSLNICGLYKKVVLEVITDMKSLVIVTDCVKKDCYSQLSFWVPD